MADSIDGIGLEITKKGPKYMYDMDLDTSKRYAKISSELVPVSRVDAMSAAGSAQILSQRPVYGTAFIEGIDSLEMPKGYGFWAQIEAPANYYTQKIIPGTMGDQLFSTISSEHLKACVEKLSLPVEQIASTIGETREYAFEWEKVREQEQMSKELSVLRESFSEVHRLTEIAESIHKLRNQFQQG